MQAGKKRHSDAGWKDLQPLQPSISSYCRWSKRIVEILSSDSEQNIVITYTLGDKETRKRIKDGFYNGVEGDSLMARERNRALAKRAIEFEQDLDSFFGKCLLAMSPIVSKLIREHPKFPKIREKQKTAKFWKLIKSVMLESFGGQAALQRAQVFWDNLKQQDGESFYQFDERLERVQMELELLGMPIVPSARLNKFIIGVNEKRYKVVKEQVATIIETMSEPPDMKTLVKMFTNSALRAKSAGKLDGSQKEKQIAAMNRKRQSKSDQGKEGGDKKARTYECYHCHEQGHIKKNCPKLIGVSEQNNTSKSSKETSSQYLDTAANIGLTAQMHGLLNVSTDSGKFKNANGALQAYHAEGVHPDFGQMVVLRNAPMEIVSFSEMREKYKPEFVDEKDMFIFRERETGTLRYVAEGKDGVYPIRTLTSGAQMDKVNKKLIASVHLQGKKSVSAMELHQRVLHSSAQCMKKSLQLGHYGDVTDGKYDENSWDLISQCAICKMFKDGRLLDQERGAEYLPKRITAQPAEVVEENISWKEPIDVTIHFDLVYVASSISCLMVVGPHNYTLQCWLKDRTATELLKTIVFMVKTIMASKGVRKVLSISVDRERAIPTIEQQLVTALEVLLKQPVPYKHEKRIERQVRTARNRFRTTRGDLKVLITRSLEMLMWEHVAKASNFIRNVHSGSYLPVQIQHGLENYRTPPMFGTFVWVSVGVPNSKDDARNEVGMIVGFEERTRAVYIKFRGRKDIVVRDSYSVIKDQDEGFQRYTCDYHDDEDEVGDEDSIDIKPVSEDEFESMSSGPAMGDAQDSLKKLFDSLESTNPTDHHSEIQENDKDEESSHESIDESSLVLRRSARSMKPNRQPGFIYGLKKMVEHQMEHPDSTVSRLKVICGLMEEAMIQGEVGKKAAAIIELTQVWKKYNAIKPVRLDDGQAKEIIRGKLFVVEKKNASGEFVKNKARLVARGDMRLEKPTEVQDTFSPTIAFPSFLSLLNIILFKNLSYMVMDVESAYLNAEFEDGIFMVLDPKVAAIMVEMDPKVKEFLRADGSLHVQIVKALYGLQESAKLWYDTLGTTLVNMGFRRSNHDHALYFKGTGDQNVIVLVYVDDMLVSGNAEEVMETKRLLEKQYALKSSELNPKSFDYVGVRVEYEQDDHAFKVSQPGMIKEIVKGVNGTEELPCDVKLYVESDEAAFTDTTLFRSDLMKMSYVTKTRPDIKVAVGYLATKMQSPSNGDLKKLERVKKYINGTQHLKMRLKPINEFQVYASADASFGPHKDGKSNTGCIVTIGTPNAPVIAKSAKQKSVANSSTAAELIAFSTTLEEVLWMVELLEEIGHSQGPVTVEQDNQSTMRLIEKGPTSTGRTKWLNIKHFWVTDHLKQGTVKLKYVPSLELLADGLTKPLGRKAFQMWRARILNFANMSSE